MAAKTYYVCQPYARGKKGGLLSRPPVQAPNAESARQRGERMFAAGAEIVGVDVVQMDVDEDVGEYAEPVFLARLGEVPEAQH